MTECSTNQPIASSGLKPVVASNSCVRGLKPIASQVMNRKKGQRRRWIVALAMGALLTGGTGCTMLSGLSNKLTDTECLDEFMISHRNKVMATKAWLRVENCYRDHPSWKDFRAGFIAGYMDVATGGSGCTPVVVSSKYWGWRHQSAHGQNSVNAWFAGFPYGVKAAEEDGIAHFNQIQMQSVPVARPAMTGSMAPKPVEPVPVAEPPTPLPSGIILGEGETLVPDKTEVRDMPMEGPTVVPPPAGEIIEGPDPTMPSLEPQASGSGTQRTPSGTEALGVGKPMLTAKESADVEMVLGQTSTVSTVSARSIGFEAESSQAEIDSVIEEVFGTPTDWGSLSPN